MRPARGRIGLHEVPVELGQRDVRAASPFGFQLNARTQVQPRPLSDWRALVCVLAEKVVHDELAPGASSVRTPARAPPASASPASSGGCAAVFATMSVRNRRPMTAAALSAASQPAGRSANLSANASRTPGGIPPCPAFSSHDTCCT
jgi:hypothetical protein